MKIDRLFTEAGKDPFAYFEYEQHRCLITHHVTKEVKMDYTGEVPKHWSHNARNVLISKYFRKGGVPTIQLHRQLHRQRSGRGWLRDMPRRRSNWWREERQASCPSHRRPLDVRRIHQRLLRRGRQAWLMKQQKQTKRLSTTPAARSKHCSTRSTTAINSRMPCVNKTRVRSTTRTSTSS
jgi:hypothetical protein